MERKTKFYSDILLAIELVNGFVKDTKSFDAYLSDKKTKSAVERQLGIIGEAVNNLRKIEPDNFFSQSAHSFLRQR
jgi:uncharacterized protein with HEPN domain